MEIHPYPKMLLKLHRRRADIELSPEEYQRGKVWSKDKQQLLMDTILKKMHIPPIYFRVLENGYYECVDGQQRCTAVFDFFDDKFPLSKKYSAEFGGKLFKELPTEIQDRFYDYEIMIFEIVNASDDETKEMFKRLQKGMPLTAGEKLKAETGNIRNFILELTKTGFFSDVVNVRDYRGAYYQMCSQILALEIFGIKDVKFKILEDMHTENRNLDLDGRVPTQVKKVTKKGSDFN